MQIFKNNKKKKKKKEKEIMKNEQNQTKEQVFAQYRIIPCIKRKGGTEELKAIYFNSK